MGLENSIYLTIRDKETHIVQYEVSVAYWRRYFSVRDTLLRLFKNERYLIEQKSEYLFICSPNILTSVISELMENIGTLDCELWTNSFWEPVISRDRTIRNVANLYALQAWIYDPENEDALNICRYDTNDDIGWYKTYMKNKDKYEILITFEDSY